MKKKNFGTTIKILRITYGLSQCELGRLSGIGPAAIVKIECGQKVRLNSYQIGELASILCCNREYLLDLYGWKPGDDSVSDYLNFIADEDLWTEEISLDVFGVAV